MQALASDANKSGSQPISLLLSLHRFECRYRHHACIRSHPRDFRSNGSCSCLTDTAELDEMRWVVLSLLLNISIYSSACRLNNSRQVSDKPYNYDSSADSDQNGKQRLQTTSDRMKRMFDIEMIAEALMSKQVTVNTLAPRLGVIQKKGLEDYRIKSSDPDIIEIAVGIPEGGNAKSAPEFVQLNFTPESHVSVTRIVPHCAEWKIVATAPGASPYLYACRYEASTSSLEVQFFAAYNHNMHDLNAHLVKLLIRRTEW